LQDHILLLQDDYWKFYRPKYYDIRTCYQGGCLKLPPAVTQHPKDGRLEVSQFTRSSAQRWNPALLTTSPLFSRQSINAEYLSDHVMFGTS
jgi:hypothetical protein